MSMTRWIITIILTSCVCYTQAYSADLLQVYNEAVDSDPTFKAAQATYLANKENLPIARSALLPSLILTGTSQRQRIEQNSSPDPFEISGVTYNTFHDYVLSAAQPIFNYSAWFNIKNASYQVKQAEANFCASTQDLIVRTAQAYFSVLQASDTLRYTQMQKRAVSEQLRQTRNQYEVGLVAITGLKEAQANYDLLIAQEIAAKNTLSNAVEQLRSITGNTYYTLRGTNGDLPLVHPDPFDIESWVETSCRQNFQLQAAIAAANAAAQNIKVQQGGHFPVINAVGSVEYVNESNPASASLGTLTQTTISGGVAVNFPIFQGGLVNAQTRQAEALYQQAISQMDFTHRSITQQTRDAFLGVLTGINKIRADQQAVISNTVALQATRNGYEAGTRTTLDVLNSQSALYQAQQTFSQDQYNYLISIINLKEAAGTLGPQDLAEINSWLNVNVNVSPAVYNINLQSYEKTTTTIDAYQTTIPKPVKKISKPKHKQIIKDAKKVPEKTLPMPAKKKIHADKAINGNYYTLVLFDTRLEIRAKHFITDHGLDGKASYISIKNPKGDTRYLVIYGNYISEQQAQEVLKTLPIYLRELNPWVKKVTAETESPILST